jgi:hypothetical protein
MIISYFQFQGMGTTAQDYTSSVMPNYSGQLTYPAYTYPANALTSTLYAPSAVASYNQTYSNLAASAQLQPNSMTAAYNFSMGINPVRKIENVSYWLNFQVSSNAAAVIANQLSSNSSPPLGSSDILDEANTSNGSSNSIGGYHSTSKRQRNSNQDGQVTLTEAELVGRFIC